MAEDKNANGYVVIQDGVAYTTGTVKDGDQEYHVLTRGERVPDGIDQKQIDRWLEIEPFGAIAPADSELAALGSSGAPVATDPAAAVRRLAAAHAKLTATKDSDEDPNAGFVDPAHEPSGEVKTGQNASVAQTRRLAMDGLDRDQLKAQAEALGVKVGARDSAEKIRGEIEAKQAEAASSGDAS